MSNLEEVRTEVMELESIIEVLSQRIAGYKISTKDGVEKRVTLAKMQIDLGKHSRRLKELKKLI